MNSERIELSADVCNGKPVIKGTRISVQTVIGFLSAGDSIEMVLEAFPTLKREDVLACLAYAQRVASLHTSIERVA